MSGSNKRTSNFRFLHHFATRLNCKLEQKVKGYSSFCTMRAGTETATDEIRMCINRTVLANIPDLNGKWMQTWKRQANTFAKRDAIKLWDILCAFFSWIMFNAHVNSWWCVSVLKYHLPYLHSFPRWIFVKKSVFFLFKQREITLGHLRTKFRGTYLALTAGNMAGGQWSCIMSNFIVPALRQALSK
jgi:hypothetical protein